MLVKLPGTLVGEQQSSRAWLQAAQGGSRPGGGRGKGRRAAAALLGDLRAAAHRARGRGARAAVLHCHVHGAAQRTLQPLRPPAAHGRQ